MKTVGVVVDNYKLKKFKKELIAAGYSNFDIEPFKRPNVKDASLLKVKVPDENMKAVEKLCKEIGLHFRRGN